jgi:hypothetical protein
VRGTFDTRLIGALFIRKVFLRCAGNIPSHCQAKSGMVMMGLMNNDKRHFGPNSQRYLRARQV